MITHTRMLKSLTKDELTVLEDELLVEIDNLDEEISALLANVSEVWSEYGVYDSSIGDTVLHGNAYHYEENLQAEIIEKEELVSSLESQLENVYSLMDERK